MTLSNVNIIDEALFKRRDLLLREIEEEGRNLLTKIRFEYGCYDKIKTKELLLIQELLEKDCFSTEELEKVNERITKLTYKQINI